MTKTIFLSSVTNSCNRHFLIIQTVLEQIDNFMQLHINNYFVNLSAIIAKELYIKTRKMYLACSMNFSRLFCMTFSNNLNLFTRASLSSDMLDSDPGFGSCEETSPVTSFVCCCSECFSETFWLLVASFVSSLCSIFSVYKSRGPPNLRWAGGDRKHPLRMRNGVRLATTLKVSCRSSSKSWPSGTVISATMGLITGLCAFLYHLPQIYKWLLKPYYIVSFFMTIAFLVVRKAPGVCEHLATEREDENSCDFDWVRAWRSLLAHSPGLVLCWPLLREVFILFYKSLDSSSREK